MPSQAKQGSFDFSSLFAADGVSFEGCRAGLDGGAIYTTTTVALTNEENSPWSSTVLRSNFATGSGGAVMAYGCAAVIQIDVSLRVLVASNTASLDGGGLAFDQGGSIIITAESCSSVDCNAELIGNGICDPTCLSRGCNWCHTRVGFRSLIFVLDTFA